jgi:hypothetical protein
LRRRAAQSGHEAKFHAGTENCFAPFWRPADGTCALAAGQKIFLLICATQNNFPFFLRTFLPGGMIFR